MYGLPPGRDRIARVIPGAVICLSLAILGAIILLGRSNLRRQIREQIAGRDSQILYALTLSQLAASQLNEEANPFTDDPVDQLKAILEASQLHSLSGLIGTRLFSRTGDFVVPFPEHIPEGKIAGADLEFVRNLKPVSHFLPKVHLSELSLFHLASDDNEPTVPILQVFVPLHRKQDKHLLGIAEFILNGDDIAAEFARLDRNLFVQAAVAFLAGGGFMVIALGLAFRHVQRANQLLTERTRSLLQANQELALAAKTSAIGAVSAHLIHGLKSPLFGLHNFMANRELPDSEKDTDWELAVSTTRRMHSMLNEIVRVLKEENGISQYEISLAELVDMLSPKIQSLADEKDVSWEINLQTEAILPNRTANLLQLILGNLLYNAVQATPHGKSVLLKIIRTGPKIACQISDQGPGLPDRVRQNLFSPCQSAKEGGSGIGLAISKQLANHLGVELELAHTSDAGTTFTVILPDKLLLQPKLDSSSNPR